MRNITVKQTTFFLTFAIALYITTTTWRVDNLHQRVIQLEQQVRVK